MQYLTFKLNDEIYAIKTEIVKNISEMLPIEEVPMAPDYIKGMVNLRGKVILIVDSHKLISEQENKNIEKLIIFLRTIDDEDFGLAVDEVFEIVDVNDDEVQKIDGYIKYYISGVIKKEDSIILVVDFEKIIKTLRNEG